MPCAWERSTRCTARPLPAAGVDAGRAAFGETLRGFCKGVQGASTQYVQSTEFGVHVASSWGNRLRGSWCGANWVETVASRSVNLQFSIYNLQFSIVLLRDENIEN